MKTVISHFRFPGEFLALSRRSRALETWSTKVIGIIPTPSPAMTQRLTQLEDGLNEVMMSSIPDLNDRGNSLATCTETLWKRTGELLRL